MKEIIVKGLIDVNARGVCGTCKHRDADGHCQNDKLAENWWHEEDGKADMLIYDYIEGGGFWVGELFGCVHHTPRAGRDDGAARKCKIEYNVKMVPSADQLEPIKFFNFANGLSANCPPHLASDVGHELANQSGTFGLLWYINHEGKCLCSLRSNGDYDVSAIAKAFGGGGHRNAAGFETSITTLLEWIK